jgi:plastocyanin
MTRSMTLNALSMGLAASTVLALSTALSGCGGASPDSSEAVVVPERGANVPTVAPAAAPNATAAAPGPASTAPAAASTSAPAAGKAGGWGTLKGQVVFDGNPPTPAVLEEKGKAEKDPQYCAKDAPIASERLLVDTSTKGVKNVLVYLPRPTAVNEEAKSAAASTKIEFDQSKCVFIPHVLALMTGSKIEIKSSDPVNHNVDAKLSKNPIFNQILASGQSFPLTLAAPERPSLVICDIHPWMQAWWLVLDNPYFAVTDEKGNYEIKNVPAGNQKVVVWQEATQFVTPPSGEEVAIAADAPTTKSFKVDASKVKPAR